MHPSVFAYLDYRQYLSDVFVDMRRSDPDFSFRAFGRMAGSTSPNYLQLIQSRILNIRPAAVAKLAKALSLGRRERRYLETLVMFDHAKTHAEKDRHFRAILRTREYGVVKQIDKSQYDYFSHWYIPVVRELVTHPEYPGDPLWIAKRIVPPVNVRKVKQGVTLLAALGLIHRDRRGNRWVQTDKVVSTPSEVFSLAVTKYHGDSILVGREAIQRFGPAERDIRSVTLGLSGPKFLEVKKRLEAFWKELLASAQEDQAVERVCQLNMQLFPVSARIAKRGKS